MAEVQKMQGAIFCHAIHGNNVPPPTKVGVSPRNSSRSRDVQDV
jgi:hypothetical protein